MREQQTLSELTVTDIAEEGRGVARANDLVVFIDKAIPGDIVDVTVYRKKKKFAEGKITNLVKLAFVEVANGNIWIMQLN